MTAVACMLCVSTAVAQDNDRPTSTPIPPTRTLPTTPLGGQPSDDGPSTVPTIPPPQSGATPTPPPPTGGSAPPPVPASGPVTIRGTTQQRPADITGAERIRLDFYDADLYQLIKQFAETHRIDFVLSDVKELQGKKVHIISQKEVSKDEAWLAFLSAMEVAGFTVALEGNIGKVVKTSEASQSTIPVGSGQPSRGTGDAFITQLIQLENVSVAEVQKVVTTLVPSEAKVVAYAPTNTLIITDTANNLRKVFKVLSELDVAAPKSSLKIYQVKYAEATEVKRIIEEIYGTEDTSQSQSSSSRSSRSSRVSSRSRSSRTPEPTSAEGVTAGKEAKYISKVIEDERTNAVIVLANDQGHEAVVKLISEIDVDVDPQNRAQIHVVYLEHAKAEEVAQVLSELSQERGGSSRGRSQTTQRTPTTVRGREAPSQSGDGSESSVIAAFDSGMRIAADENTNSLVIIANQEDFRVVSGVIRQLDIERKQVFVDAVILELSSEDTFNLGLAAHLPTQPDPNAAGFIGGQFGTQSLGLTQDLLSGLAVGVFGESVEVPLADGTVLPIPAFGIVLNALKTNSAVNIVSNPNLLTLDNQEAEIVVGRRIPFPTTAGLSNLGQPVVSFQREDVAITLKVTPRVNSSNYVTMEVEVEVQEIEEDDAGLNIQQSGPITSKRSEKSTVLVRDNQTVVLGGLVGSTDTEVETKLPILGDLPLVGQLFRGRKTGTRKTNMMIFLTPHIIDDAEDMYEVQRVKEAQRQEFLRRFYGKSKDEYMNQMRSLLRFSVNQVDEPSMYRGPTTVQEDLTIDGESISDETMDAMEAAIQDVRGSEPGAGAGVIDGASDDLIIVDETLPDAPQTDVPVDGPQPDAPPAEEP